MIIDFDLPFASCRVCLFKEVESEQISWSGDCVLYIILIASFTISVSEENFKFSCSISFDGQLKVLSDLRLKTHWLVNFHLPNGFF